MGREKDVEGERVKGLRRGGWGKGGNKLEGGNERCEVRCESLDGWCEEREEKRKDCVDLFGSGFHVYAEKLLVATTYENWRVGNLEREDDGIGGRGVEVCKNAASRRLEPLSWKKSAM